MADTINIMGTYSWELVFDYTNDKASSVVVEMTRSESKKVSGKDFVSHHFSSNIETNYSYGGGSSSILSFSGGGSQFSVHTETAYDLVKTAETSTDIETSSSQKVTIKIGPKGSKKVYQLIYSMDNVFVRSGIYSDNPSKVGPVTLNFSLSSALPGLTELLSVFGTTMPGSSNTVEWATIRSNVVEFTDRSEEERLHAFVECLSGITPGSSNVDEWASIRLTCNQIKASWNSVPKPQLFRKLLTQFHQTVPGSENTVEWAAIRKTVEPILDAMRYMKA